MYKMADNMLVDKTSYTCIFLISPMLWDLFFNALDVSLHMGLMVKENSFSLSETLT